MHYQLFIPGVNTQNPQMLVDVGLADFVAGADFMSGQEGPDDSNDLGTFIAWQKPGKVGIGYQSHCQTWIPAVQHEGLEAGRYWVGFWNDSPVTPDDLQRPYAKPGKLIELGDSNTWRVPIITQLPQDMVLADDGTWKFETQRQYHDLWLQMGEWQERIRDPQITTYSFAEIADFCALVLCQNYRLTREAISYLRLFDTENIEDILLAAVGFSNGE